MVQKMKCIVAAAAVGAAVAALGAEFALVKDGAAAAAETARETHIPTARAAPAEAASSSSATSTSRVASSS